MMASFINLTQAVAGVHGPILGGAIIHDQSSSTWCRIFYVNLQLCCLALTALLVAWPWRAHTFVSSKTRNGSVDSVGAALLLASSALLVFALQEGAARAYAWNSSTIDATPTIFGVGFVGFVLWNLASFAAKKASSLQYLPSFSRPIEL